jgi:riboflavin kinase/FMN adenylyltransferase
MIRVMEWGQLCKQPGPALQVALTIGAFDCLHVGHQRLIHGIIDNSYGAIATVCTFSQNPASVLGNRPFPGSILSHFQKVRKLEQLGVALVVLIDFSPEISTLTGESFLNLLANRLDVKKLVVGYDFHMGRGRDTNTQELVGILTDSGIELEIVPAAMYDNEAVSSSRIRDSIRQGRFSEAKDMLRDDYRLDLRNIAIQESEGGCWMRRSEIEQVLPRIGEYPVRFLTDSAEISGILTVEEERLYWQEQIAGTEIEICF